MYINQGDVLTLSINAQAPFGGSGDSVLANVALLLQNDNLRMVSKNVATSSFMSNLGALAGLVGPQYLATIQVQALSDFSSETDVADLVAHEIYSATSTLGYGGNYPTISVTAVNSQATGMSSAGTPDTGATVSDIVSNFFSGLSTAGTTLTIVVVGILILALVLIAYGPNIPGVAHAATAAAIV